MWAEERNCWTVSNNVPKSKCQFFASEMSKRYSRRRFSQEFLSIICKKNEKFCVKNDAAPEALSANRTKGIASESSMFGSRVPTLLIPSNSPMLPGKVLWQKLLAAL